MRTKTQTGLLWCSEAVVDGTLGVYEHLGKYGLVISASYFRCFDDDECDTARDRANVE